jgi:hypothetical protein
VLQFSHTSSIYTSCCQPPLIVTPPISSTSSAPNLRNTHPCKSPHPQLSSSKASLACEASRPNTGISLQIHHHRRNRMRHCLIWFVDFWNWRVPFYTPHLLGESSHKSKSQKQGINNLYSRKRCTVILESLESIYNIFYYFAFFYKARARKKRNIV